MMSLTQTTVYAVQALSRIPTGGNGSCQIRELAAMAGVPKPYLAKIINKLAHRGLVDAKRGYRGGVALCRPAHKISLLDVVEAVEGEDWISDCLLETGCCGTPEACPTGQGWTKVREEIKDLLRSTTLSEAAALSGPNDGAPRQRRASRRRRRGPQGMVGFSG